MDDSSLPGQADVRSSAQVPDPQVAGGTYPPPFPPGGGPLPVPPKRRILTTPFVMGVITPPLLLWGVGAAVAALVNWLGAGNQLGIGFGAVMAVFFLVGLALFIVGRQTGRETMRGYGLGVMVSYGLFAALALLAYGTCGVLLGGAGA